MTMLSNLLTHSSASGLRLANAFPCIGMIVLGFGLIFSLTGCDQSEEPIRTGTTPTNERIAKTAEPMQPDPQEQQASFTVTWTLPEGWREIETDKEFRVKTVMVPTLDDGKELELVVTAFPAYSGTSEMDITRWKRQHFTSQQELVDVQISNVDLSQGAGKLYDLTGPVISEDIAPMRVLAYRIDTGQTAWFVKVAGPSDRIESIYDDVQELVRTTNFQTTMGPPSDKMYLATWGDLPEDWQRVDENDLPPGLMAQYLIPAGEKQARLDVRRVPDVGFSEIVTMNRWRRMVGLPPVMEARDAWSDFIKFSPPVTEGEESKPYFILIFNSQEGFNQHPLQLMVSLHKSPDANWMFELIGPPEVLEKQLEIFKGMILSISMKEIDAEAKNP